jgi:hypothetical protein
MTNSFSFFSPSLFFLFLFHPTGLVVCVLNKLTYVCENDLPSGQAVPKRNRIVGTRAGHADKVPFNM